MDLNRLWAFLFGTMRVGFVVGCIGLVCIFATGLMRWRPLSEAAKVVFFIGFAPLFAAGVVLMVLNVLGKRPKP